jgi:peptidoglycan/xylan/chitin deacetylase (PgdA/CDA1 family)
MYLIRTPSFIQSLFPNFIWRMPNEDKVLYLTFDDGPIEEVTPWVLDELAKYNAKATFFCVGENVDRNPKIFERMKREGHTTANHTYHHLSGWSSDNVPYFHNVRKCAHLVDSDLFRPPYGRMKPSQAQFLLRHYRIVMWDVLSADFDTNISQEQCLSNVLSNSKPGSIIVMHDSVKAKKNMQYTLPRVLDHFSTLGYRFEKINAHASQISTDLKQIA